MNEDSPSTDPRRRLGRWGEGLAATHLETLGHLIVEQNWHCRAGEIDLVTRDGETLVFVEVKTRRGRDFGLPEEGLTPRKAEKLLRLGKQYVYEHALDDVNWRIDLVAIELDSTGKLLRCDHFPNAVFGW
ncbi:MAG: YraN family protein [Chloroflexota bacterium]|jgi:putative endonuclease